MFTKALYYPYILIPDNLWLRRAILYWDKISPIVPWEVEQEIPQTHISKELKGYGVLDFIHPEDTLGWGEGRELSEFFLKIVTSEEFLSKIGPPEKRNYSSRIHKHKFTDGLLNELRSLDLFKVKEDNYNWLLFENRTGTIYMGFLASSLANRLDLEPITDNKSYQNGFLWSQLIPSASPEIFISLVLEELLPVPKEEIPVKKLIKFKEKHERELLSFRKLIRDTIKSLGSVTDESQFMRELNSVKDDIKEQSLILHEKLKENRIESVFNVLETSFKLSVPEIGALIGATTISVPLGAVVFGVNALIKIGKETFKGYTRRNSILLERSPYTYVFNVKKKFA